MTKQLYGYLLSSRDFMKRQLSSMEGGRVRLVQCNVEPEVDVSHLAIDLLRNEIAVVEKLIKIYGVEPAVGASRPSAKKDPAGLG